VLPVTDAAVLFTVIIGVALVPISIGGWGLRELAVVSVLGGHGICTRAGVALFSVFWPYLRDWLAAGRAGMASLCVRSSWRRAECNS
jgi:hypothetical protein